MNVNVEQYVGDLRKRGEENKGIQYEFQAIGKEMVSFFGKKSAALIFSLFYKHHEKKVEEAFNVCRQKNISDIGYLLGILRR